MDVLSYELSLEPVLDSSAIWGNVCITFLNPNEEQSIVFSCGALNILEVKGPTIQDFHQKNGKLILRLSKQENKEHEVHVSYSGSPKRGLVFLNDSKGIYTAYFTSEWMPCNDSPNDKASFALDIVVPQSLTAYASGDFIQKTPVGQGRTRYSFHQNYASPAYTYGFVVGDFHMFQAHHTASYLNYFSATYDPGLLEKIFGKTPDMISFLEEKSGIKYDQGSYNQFLIGNHYQEMSGLSVLKESYGTLVLGDSTETNLISHELAHQWWGNRITCESWSHFWLNEGFATFLSAAYNEYRFGKEKYQENIDAYYKVYVSIKKRGLDKPLVFADWHNPSNEDRNLVYFKGAYVLHLLKKELGDAAFWKGIKFYSQSYFGKSVNTQNFQEALEQSSQRNLQEFFDRWIY